MKINKEQLVNFLSTATYGSDWLECSSLKSEKHLDEKFDKDYLEHRCREEKWVDRLLAGGTLRCYDYFDCDEDENPSVYDLKISDFEEKLEKASIEKDLCTKFALWWSEGDYDYCDCNDLMQYIIFGEVIYG